MDKQTEYYITRIIRMFEKYPQIAKKCTEAIEDVGFIMNETGYGDIVVQLKEYKIHKGYYTLSKKD